MPLVEVQPGMLAVVQTVFEGGRVEEFTAEIVGVMEDFLGPDQSLILARLKGERVEFTGVAAGMSGSPVYIDGRLAGALSYKLGSFLKEPIAGITPIEYMLDLSRAGNLEAGEVSGALSSPAVQDLPLLEPIETPLVVAGVPAPVLEAFGPQLERLGLGSMMPGSSGASSVPPGSSPPLEPGQSVAALLVRGDSTLAMTGTVTHVDGDRVLAFGHPALLAGPTQFPMARAEIHLTLPSLMASAKMSRVLDTVGTFEQSRLPGITGVIGPTPDLIPVNVKIAAAESGTRSFSYEVLPHLDLTPVLLGMVTASSLVNTTWYADQMTVALAGRIGLEGHPDVVLNDIYTGFSAGQSAGIALAQDVQGLFGVIFQNRFEIPTVKSIDLEVSTVEKARLTFVEGVYPSRTLLAPGEEVTFRVLLRPFRGASYTRTFTYRIPDRAPSGLLMADVGGATLIANNEGGILARRARQAGDLDQLISIVNNLRTNDRLYLKVRRRHSGAVVQSEVLPALPPSVFSTIRSGRETGEVTPLAETTIYEESFPLGQIVVGGANVVLRIR